MTKKNLNNEKNYNQSNKNHKVTSIRSEVSKDQPFEKEEIWYKPSVKKKICDEQNICKESFNQVYDVVPQNKNIVNKLTMMPSLEPQTENDKISFSHPCFSPPIQTSSNTFQSHEDFIIDIDSPIPRETTHPIIFNNNENNIHSFLNNSFKSGPIYNPLSNLSQSSLPQTLFHSPCHAPLYSSPHTTLPSSLNTSFFSPPQIQLPLFNSSYGFPDKPEKPKLRSKLKLLLKTNDKKVENFFLNNIDLNIIEKIKGVDIISMNQISSSDGESNEEDLEKDPADERFYQSMIKKYPKFNDLNLNEKIKSNTKINHLEEEFINEQDYEDIISNEKEFLMMLRIKKKGKSNEVGLIIKQSDIIIKNKYLPNKVFYKMKRIKNFYTEKRLRDKYKRDLRNFIKWTHL